MVCYLGEVAADGRVTTLSYPTLTGLEVLDPSLAASPAVHRSRYYVPATVWTEFVINIILCQESHLRPHLSTCPHPKATRGVSASSR